MVIQREEPAQVLGKWRVLYIGSSVPLETMDGLEAVQQPLRDRYPIGKQVQGMDSTLTVLNTGLQIEYMNDPDNTIVFFPISSLTLCAAVRPVNAMNATTGEVMSKFVSLNSDLAAQNAKNPAIFAAITRRMKGRRVLECHGFICACDQDSLDIVKITSFADQSKRQNGPMKNGPGSHGVVNGTGPNRSRPGSYRIVNGTVPVETTAMVNGSLRRVVVERPVSVRENVRLSAGESLPPVVDDVPQEFYESPPPQGYFYRPSTVQAKTFNIEKKEPPISSRSRVSSSFVHPADPNFIIPPSPSQPSPQQPSPSQPSQTEEPAPPLVTPQQPTSAPIPPVPEPNPNIAQQTRPPDVPPLQIPPLQMPPPPPFARPRYYMPRPMGPQYYPPPPYMRPMYPPPPPMGRPRFFSPPPMMRGPPYPYPYPYPMYPFGRRRRPKRRESESPHSSGSRHSSLKSPRDDETKEKKKFPNGDIDSESDTMFRPKTPPRDYDNVNEGPPRKERLSRREEYEMRRNRRKHDKDGQSPPRMMYSGYRPYYMYQPQSFGPYMPPDPRYQYQPRSSSVPPHLRYSSKDRKADKKKKKKNKNKGKNRYTGGGAPYPYGREDMSLDSASAMGGYTSEIPQGAYPTDGYYYYPPRPPRDFRREKNQFMSEKSFSRRLQEEQRKSKGTKQDYYPTAYELNDAQADERINEPDFTMY